MKFLVAYDIADPKRLRQVAGRLETYAQRVQKSVFIFEGSFQDMLRIHDELTGIIDIHEDRVQSWPLLETMALRRLDAGTILPSQAICVIASPEKTLILEETL